MIHIQGLEFRYAHSDFRLSVPSLQVGARERVAVIGPSGSGKTTLLNLIAGIFVPNSGEITVGNVPVHALDDAGRRVFRISNIGFVFQDFELIDYLSVLDNILHPYRITRALRLNKEVRGRAIALAEQMAIAKHIKRRPGELSQGERQRVAICRALLTQPKLVLADEATGNLDPDNKTQILDLLFANLAERDAALLAVTHDHDLLPRFDRVEDFRAFRASGEANA